MSRHERFLIQTATIAKTSLHTKWKVAALFVRGSSVVVSATNTVRNRPAIVDGIGSSFHAEEFALRRLRGRAEDLTVYVARINATGSPRLARPCMKCWTKLVSSGVRRVVYTTGTDDHYCIERIV